jgi:hypothetical protein
LLFVGCELFTTRSPEDPEGGGSGVWQFPTSPEVVLMNLESAMGRRSAVDYSRLFTLPENNLPAYVFEADPNSNAANPGVFEHWSVLNEQKHSQSLFSPANLPLDSLAQLELTVERQTLLGDSATVSCSYVLHVGHLSDGIPREMAGQASFRLLRGSDGGWYIQYWSDLRRAGTGCWSDLKAAF